MLVIPLFLLAGLLAVDMPPVNPQIDYPAFAKMTRDLQPVRLSKLICQ